MRVYFTISLNITLKVLSKGIEIKGINIRKKEMKL